VEGKQARRIIMTPLLITALVLIGLAVLRLGLPILVIFLLAKILHLFDPVSA
jgi:hypothetical protein